MILIVGVDPGTTAGYAVLDTSGRLVAAGASKELDLASLIAAVEPLGKVLYVGTDKAKVPGFVASFAAKFGAKVIAPSEDLRREDKRVMTLSFDARNDHEQDALAAALYALKQAQPLLTRIAKFIDAVGKPHLLIPLTELVVKHKFSIRAAHELLEKPEDTPVIAEAVQEKPLQRKDFVKLYNQVVELRREKEMLQEQNRKLIRALGKSKERKPVVVREATPLLAQKDRRIAQLASQLNTKEQALQAYERKVAEVYELLVRVQDLLILKRFKNLGTAEVERKMKLLHVKPGDVLLVDNADEWSPAGVAMLKELIGVIVAKQASKSAHQRLPFTVIEAKRLSIRENPQFGFVAKKEFEKEKDSREVLRKIIEDYRKERGF